MLEDSGFRKSATEDFMKPVFCVLFMYLTFSFSQARCEDELDKSPTSWWVYFNPYDLNIQKGKFDLTRVKNFTLEIPAQIDDDDEFYFYSFMTISNGSIVTKFRSGLKKDLEKRQRNIMYRILLNYFRESTKHFHDRLDNPYIILPYEINDFNGRWIEKHPGYIEKIICGELTTSKLDGYVNTNPFSKIDEDVEKITRNIGNEEN